VLRRWKLYRHRIVGNYSNEGFEGEWVSVCNRQKLVQNSETSNNATSRASSGKAVEPTGINECGNLYTVCYELAPCTDGSGPVGPAGRRRGTRIQQPPFISSSMADKRKRRGAATHDIHPFCCWPPLAVLRAACPRVAPLAVVSMLSCGLRAAQRHRRPPRNPREVSTGHWSLQVSTVVSTYLVTAVVRDCGSGT
jgi:hypothetical protein